MNKRASLVCGAILILLALATACVGETTPTTLPEVM